MARPHIDALRPAACTVGTAWAGAAAASIPLICLVDGSISASGRRAAGQQQGSEDELLLDLETDPGSGAL
eukprot:595698-Prymnesium_polylepis.1